MSMLLELLDTIKISVARSSNIHFGDSKLREKNNNVIKFIAWTDNFIKFYSTFTWVLFKNWNYFILIIICYEQLTINSFSHFQCCLIPIKTDCNFCYHLSRFTSKEKIFYSQRWFSFNKFFHLKMKIFIKLIIRCCVKQWRFIHSD